MPHPLEVRGEAEGIEHPVHPIIVWTGFLAAVQNEGMFQRCRARPPLFMRNPKTRSPTGLETHVGLGLSKSARYHAKRCESGQVMIEPIISSRLGGRCPTLRTLSVTENLFSWFGSNGTEVSVDRGRNVGRGCILMTRTLSMVRRFYPRNSNSCCTVNLKAR